MKKVIRLTESDLVRIVKRVIQEGNIDKSSKEKDLDVKMENFRDKIRDFLKSKDCKVKQVGTDFEVHCDGEHVGQVMFRRNAITVKKEGSRFGKDFKFNEMGDIKSELSKMLKKQIKESGYQGIKNDLEYETGIHDIADKLLGELLNFNETLIQLKSIFKGNSYEFNKSKSSKQLMRKIGDMYKKTIALKKLISLFEEKDMKITKSDLGDYGFEIEELLNDLEERYNEIDEFRNITDDEDLIVGLDDYENNLNNIIDVLYEIPD